MKVLASSIAALAAMLPISAWCEVSTTRALARGEIVLATELDGPLEEINRFVGQVLRRSVSDGRVLRSYDVQTPSAVVRQQTVAIEFKRLSLTLRTEGRALRDGLVGDRIDIMLPGRRRAVTGGIIAPGLVEVSP